MHEPVELVQFGKPLNNLPVLIYPKLHSSYCYYLQTVVLQRVSETIIGQNNFQLSVESNRYCIGFTSLTSLCDGPESLRHSLNQSDSTLKLITTWSPAYSRALGGLFAFTLSSHHACSKDSLASRSANATFLFLN